MPFWPGESQFVLDPSSQSESGYEAEYTPLWPAKEADRARLMAVWVSTEVGVP